MSPRLVFLLTGLSGLGCGGARGIPVDTAALSTPAGASPFAQEGWAVRHAPRAHVSLRLPDAAAWHVDDQGGVLRAEHAATTSRLVIQTSVERAVVGRVQCEALGRENGLMPEGPKVRIVETETTTLRGGYDTQVVVAIDPGEGEQSPMTGWVLAFGGHLRHCLAVRYETRVASSRDEPELALRLAAFRTGALPSLVHGSSLSGDAELRGSGGGTSPAPRR